MYYLDSWRTAKKSTVTSTFFFISKFRIHKRKLSSKKINKIESEIEHYIDTMRFSMKQKVIKTVKVCKRFNILKKVFVYS